MTSSPFHSNYNLNLNTIQDNVIINKIVPSSPSLVLANRIIRFLPNEIQANCTIKC